MDFPSLWTHVFRAEGENGIEIRNEVSKLTSNAGKLETVAHQGKTWRLFF
jgi:hypothetical protein